jgi:hypothetical protein
MAEERRDGWPPNKPLKLSAAVFSRAAAVLDTRRVGIARGRI